METGLIIIEGSTPEEQDKVFRRQIATAKEMKLPIRLATMRLKIATRFLKEGVFKISGIILVIMDESYEAFLDLGMHISCRRRSQKCAAGTRMCKISPILVTVAAVETDAASGAFVCLPWKEKLNPAMRYVVETIAKEGLA